MARTQQQQRLRLSRAAACLDELESCVWGEAKADDTNLVKRCHALRKKPIGQFAVEDLRVMIGQDIGGLHLMPFALEILRANPLSAGHFYPGDLLSAAITLPDGSWREHPAFDQDLRLLAARALDMLRGSEEGSIADPSFIKSLQQFLERPATRSSRLRPTSRKRRE